MTFDGSRVIAHSAGEISKSESQTGPIEITVEGPGHQRLELTDAGVLAPGVAVVLPGGMTRTDHSRCDRSQSLVDHQLTKGSASSGFPIGVVSARVVNQLF